MKRTILYLAAFLLAFTTILEAATRTLGSMQIIYDREMEKILGENLEKSATWIDQYKKGLLTLRSQMQKSKNLDGWVIVDKEVKRFEKDRIIAEENLSDELSELKAVQSKYLNAPSDIETQKNEDILNLNNLYCYHLRNMQDDLTEKGNIPEALKIRAEIAKARNNKDVQEAEQAVEEQEMEAEMAAEESQEEPVVIETNSAGEVADSQIKEWLQLRSDYIEKQKTSYEDFNSQDKKRSAAKAKKRWNRVKSECRKAVTQEKPTDSESLKAAKKSYRDAVTKYKETWDSLIKARNAEASKGERRQLDSAYKTAKDDLVSVIPRLEDALGWEKIPGQE